MPFRCPVAPGSLACQAAARVRVSNETKSWDTAPPRASGKPRSMRSPAPGPRRDTGRFVVPAVAAAGAIAVFFFGFAIARKRAAAFDRVPLVAQPAPVNEGASLRELESKLREAAHRLDLTALAQLEAELAATAAKPETSKMLADEARKLRAKALATRAVEASFRERLTGKDVGASTLVREATDALDDLERSGAPAARLATTRAWLSLATGNDITLTHPRVLLPDFHDPELRLAALSAKTLEEPLEPQRRAALIDEIGSNDESSALTKILLAHMLRREGKQDAARDELRAVLSKTPEQPFALAVREAETPATVVVASIPPPPPTETRRDPPEPPEAPPADPKRNADEERDDVDEADDADEQTAGRTEDKTEEKQAKRPDDRGEPAPVASTPAPRSRPGTGAEERRAGRFEALASEGCRNVRSGQASEGLAQLRRAFDLQPGTTRVTLCMAEGQFKLGNAASARALVDRVLRRSPKHKGALLLSARLEDNRGNPTGARKAYEKVLSIDPNNATAKAYLERTQ